LGQLIAFPSFRSEDAESHAVWPRLLSFAQAAAYCGLTTAAFAKACPIRPVSAGQGPQSRRFDRHELDSWIDSKCAAAEQSGWQNWLAVMEGKAS
jgi:hypothetical protein